MAKIVVSSKNLAIAIQEVGFDNFRVLKPDVLSLCKGGKVVCEISAFTSYADPLYHKFKNRGHIKKLVNLLRMLPEQPIEMQSDGWDSSKLSIHCIVEFLQ